MGKEGDCGQERGGHRTGEYSHRKRAKAVELMESRRQGALAVSLGSYVWVLVVGRILIGVCESSSSLRLCNS